MSLKERSFWQIFSIYCFLNCSLLSYGHISSLSSTSASSLLKYQNPSAALSCPSTLTSLSMWAYSVHSWYILLTAHIPPLPTYLSNPTASVTRRILAQGLRWSPGQTKTSRESWSETYLFQVWGWTGRYMYSSTSSTAKEYSHYSTPTLTDTSSRLLKSGCSYLWLRISTSTQPSSEQNLKGQRRLCPSPRPFQSSSSPQLQALNCQGA